MHVLFEMTWGALGSHGKYAMRETCTVATCGLVLSCMMGVGGGLGSHAYPLKKKSEIIYHLPQFYLVYKKKLVERTWWGWLYRSRPD